MRTVTDAAYAGDIVSRLRNWRGLHLAHGGDLFDEAAAAIESLRREVRQQRLEIAGLREERRADRLAALQRLTELDEEMERTPARNGTPGECTVPPEWTSRPFYVDPPSGWAYGFPRLYDPAKDGDMVEWMIRHGYPEKLARQGLPCTFTAQE